MDSVETRQVSESTTCLPVSVIVPVLNDAERIGDCLDALVSQSYPRDLVEIIVVDNGSTDDTRTIASRYPVTVVCETRGKSPYLARNTGIERSLGEVIALTDATCTPVSDWIEQGIRALEEHSADLAGGRIAFTFSAERTAGESFDSISNLEMERNIRERGVAKTGNLFVRRRVFDSVGLFPAQVRSGGDVEWTGRATRAGFRMVYAPDATVYKPARPLRSLLRKQYRVGQGQPAIWRSAGRGTNEAVRRILFGFLPPSPGAIRRAIRRRGLPEMEPEWLSIWAVGWLCKVVTNVGRIRAYARREQQ